SLAVRQTGIPEDVDGGDARIEGPLEPAQDLLEAALRADGYRRPGASDRLLEFGESADRACFGAAERDRRPAGVRRWARQPRPPTAVGKSRARGRWRVSGHRSGGDDRPGANRFSALWAYPPLAIQHAGLDRARFHLRDLAAGRHALRLGSGTPIHAAATGEYIEGPGGRSD